MVSSQIMWSILLLLDESVDTNASLTKYLGKFKCKNKKLKKSQGEESHYHDQFWKKMFSMTLIFRHGY